MKTLTKHAVLSTALLLASTQTSYAAGFSVGIFAGQSSSDEIGELCQEAAGSVNSRLSSQGLTGRFATCSDVGDSDSAFGANLAFNFTNSFGIEVGFVDFGEFSSSISVLNQSVDARLGLDARYAALVGTIPFSNNLSLSLRGGAVSASLEGEVSSSVAGFSQTLPDIEDETGGFAGASIDYLITDHVGFQIRYDNYDVIEVVSAGLRYHF